MPIKPNKPQRPPLRSEALSKERIVEAAIAILDVGAESALTFRALAAQLETGSGAIYWHVDNKDELLAAAADHIIASVMSDLVQAAEPRAMIRAIALGLFDAIDTHPWVGAQLPRDPTRSAPLQIFESIGDQLLRLGVPQHALFTSASALVNYILGVAGQNAANARLAPRDMDRSTFLANVAARWTQQDPARYPFVHRIAAQLRDHDDREQFLAGIDLILTGIASVR